MTEASETLVERLRAVNVHRFGGVKQGRELRNPDGPEAADEIERLRAALRVYLSDCTNEECEYCIAARAALNGDSHDHP